MITAAPLRHPILLLVLCSNISALVWLMLRCQEDIQILYLTDLQVAWANTMGDLVLPAESLGTRLGFLGELH